MLLFHLHFELPPDIILQLFYCKWHPEI